MTDLIECNDIFHFDGLSLAANPDGIAPVADIPDMDPTTLGGVLVKVIDVTWTGDLRILRGNLRRSADGYPDGGYEFPKKKHAVTIPISTAATLIEQGAWRRYRY